MKHSPFHPHRVLRQALGLLACTIVLLGCTEHIDTSARYVFSDYTISSYLEKYADVYGEYLHLLEVVPVSDVSKTTLRQLFSARGHYTVFAPTNEAIGAYLQELYEKDIIDEPSWNGFRDSTDLDSVRQVIVKNSIIDCGDNLEAFLTCDFPIRQDAELPVATMYDRRLTVHWGEEGGEPDLAVSGAPIDEKNRDIPVTNGVIHAVHKVVAPSNNTLGFWFSQILKFHREGFHVTALLAEACGLLDTLNAVRDDAYEDLMRRGAYDDFRQDVIPQHRYYGYTFFAETDSVWSELLGKPAMDITVQDVADFLTNMNAIPDAVYDGNYTSKMNFLNQFVTYHILPEKLASDRLIYHYNEIGYNRATQELGVAMAEYYTTMGRRRLLKIFESKESHGVYLNRFPNLDNGRRGSYHELSCDAGKEGFLLGPLNLEGDNMLRNAYVYPLDRLFLFDVATQQNLGRERIRIDGAATSPEFINNDIRMSLIQEVWRFPQDNVYRYLDDMWFSDTTDPVYNTARSYLPPNYGNDEWLIYGSQDVTLRLPPVPRRDMYEIRWSCSNVPIYVQVFQVYFGEDPNKLAACGIPLDFRQGGLYYVDGRESHMGWEADTDDDDYNAEIDKRLRNNGFMKAPNIYYSGSEPCRTNHQLTRRILVREMLDPDKTYYFRIKACLDMEISQLFWDFLEICPKSVYDNPNEPEDIW